MTMTPQQVASEALQWLARDGWCKGAVTLMATAKAMMTSYPEHWSPDMPSWRIGAHCAGGAVNLALSGGKSAWWNHDDSAYAAIAAVIGLRHPLIAERTANRATPAMAALMIWNDSAETTYDEVISVLREVADGT